MHAETDVALHQLGQLGLHGRASSRLMSMDTSSSGRLQFSVENA